MKKYYESPAAETVDITLEFNILSGENQLSSPNDYSEGGEGFDW